MALSKYGHIFNPFWDDTVTVDYWGIADSSSLPAGIDFVNAAPAHPLATGLGEYWVKVSANSNHSLSYNATRMPAEPEAGFSGTQEAIRISYLFRVETSTPPSEVYLTVFGAALNWSIRLDTSRRLLLYVNGVLFGRSQEVVAVDTNYQLEIWGISEDKQGRKIGIGGTESNLHWQLVVRLISNITTTRDVTTFINVNVPRVVAGTNTNPFSGTGGSTTVQMGGTNVGSTMVWYYGNVYIAVEDANDPYGIIRVDWMIPNGLGLTEWTAAANAANVDEATPNDATDIDSDTLGAAASPEDQLYTFPDPTNIVSGDEVLTITAWVRHNVDTPAKGAFTRLHIRYGDGTDTETSTNFIAGNGAWGSFNDDFDHEAGAGEGTLDFGDLQNLQLGVRATTDTAGTHTFRISTLMALVAYQEDGETTAALPTESLFRRPVKHHRERGMSEPKRHKKRHGFVQGGTLFLQSLSGTLSGFSGLLTKMTGKNLVGDQTIGPGETDPDLIARRTLGGTLSGWSGALTPLKIFNPANLINILQRLRKRGDH